MKFKDFFAKATHNLPHVSTSLDGAAVNILIVSEKNYNDDIIRLSKDHEKINAYIKNIPYFEHKDGKAIYVPLDKKYLIICASEDLSRKCVTEQQNFGAKISTYANSYKIQSINIKSPSDITKCTLKNIVYGLLLRNYRFNDFFHKKLEDKKTYLKNIHIDQLEPDEITEIVNIVQNVMLTRHLVNYPSTDLNPTSYSTLIEEGFEENVSVKIVDANHMKTLGMNMLLAVGRAGANQPKMVVMEYNGNNLSKEYDLALVGKGVCFDSGGLSIKPANSMEDMKIDMAGSAVSFASIRLIAQMKLKVNVVALVGLVENLVDNTAYRPGDILTSMSGQTVEVLNTDAEGRLVLGDILYYAQKYYKPKYMVNYATLTGAVVVCLGDIYAGYMSNDDEIATKLEEAANNSGDLIWRLPLRKAYDAMIDSTVADMKNIGSNRGAGTITAGQFLARFVNCEDGMKTKWAHLDIAGVAYDGKGAADPKVVRGATGHSVYLTYKFAQKI